jgi:hypothetical protein
VSGDGWEDDVLPMFDQPAAPVQRQLSAKDKDDALNKVTWRRYKVAGIVCWEWVNSPDGLRQSQCGPATWLRVQGADQRALCFRHRQEYLHREALEAPREQ